MTHTPIPLTIKRESDNQGYNGIALVAPDGRVIANMVMQLDDKEMEYAKSIITACNAHEELVAALEECIEHLGMIPDYEKTNGDKAAIEKSLKALSSIKKGA